MKNRRFPFGRIAFTLCLGLFAIEAAFAQGKPSDRASGAASTRREVVANGSFSHGLSHWSKQGQLELKVLEPDANVASDAGGTPSVLMSSRKSYDASVVQDIRERLEKAGPGWYEISARLRTARGSETGSIAVKVNGEIITTSQAGIDDKGFTRISAKRLVNWDGGLRTAVIYSASRRQAETMANISSDTSKNHPDLIIAGLSMVKVSDRVTVDTPRPDPGLRPKRAIIGAIRWDGYTGEADAVGRGVNKALGPAKYHYRVPFYGRITGPDSVDIPAPTLSTIEKEIRYAHAGGIDYWAFDWYPAGYHQMDSARKLYLSSPLSSEVKWCVILGTAGFSLKNDLPGLVEEMKRDRYQKVLGERPLIYYMGAKREVAKTIAAIREACKEAGLANPYVVGMAWSANQAASNLMDSGCDAMTQYAAGGAQGAAFRDYAASQKSAWEKYSKTGMQVVPWVATSWDSRPYFDNPSPFYIEKDDTRWVRQGTPKEIAGLLKEALDWNKAHPKANVANTVLIYAWNENTEGGWIIPTLFEIRDSGRPQRLDAIRDTLK